MNETLTITATVNGQAVTRDVHARTHLIDFLRDDLELTGSHVGCEHGVCGACSIRVDGKVVRGCLTLAVQVDGKRVDTIEGLSDTGELAEIQAAFHRHNALQCGYCTPGMLVTAKDLIDTMPDANRDQIREYLSGNYCRCTGYQAIVDAIESVLIAHRQPASSSLSSVAASLGLGSQGKGV
jgi:aerobic-type carbon monoxide dehydrogenase small subunit (CoxS/CutS family)